MLTGIMIFIYGLMFFVLVASVYSGFSRLTGKGRGMAMDSPFSAPAWPGSISENADLGMET